MGYVASTVGLRPAACVAWVRIRPGTGGLLRASPDPVLMVSRGVPDAVDRAATRNVVTADYPARRSDRTRNRRKFMSTSLSRIRPWKIADLLAAPKTQVRALACVGL